MSSESLHAPRDRLQPQTVRVHQAIVSLMEELEAVDWYQQRSDDCDDAGLRDILLHNMREEVEHAAMLLEWLRRNHPEFAAQLRHYLFSEGPITGVEQAEAQGEPAPSRRPSPPRSSIGSLK
jgi:ferritin-like protein